MKKINDLKEDPSVLLKPYRDELLAKITQLSE